MSYVEYAKRSAEWIMRTQITSKMDLGNSVGYDMEDMNYGRYCRNFDIKEMRPQAYGTNWQNGMAMYALLMLNDLNNDKRLIASSQASALFLSMLQITFHENSKAIGAIYECHPKTCHCHCRDATSAAWGFLRLHRSTGDFLYLKRAMLFADWHKKYAFNGDYPVATFFFDDRPREEDIFNCQGGTALFYYDLYNITHCSEYYDAMFKIVDYYIENMFDKYTGPVIFIDPKTKQKSDSLDPASAVWSDMHKYNDDFGCLAVLAAWKISGDSKYLNFVEEYLAWCLLQQHDDGSFGIQSLSVSSCIAALNLLNAYLITEKKQYYFAANKAISHLMKNFINSPDNKIIDGGFLGMGTRCEKTDNSISLRVTTYAIILFIAYESIISSVPNKNMLPASLINNPMLIGLRCKLEA